MALLHKTRDIHIVNTVSKLRVNFYGETKEIHDPDNKITVKVDLWMVVGTGKRGYQSKSITSKIFYACVYDIATKTLTKDGAAVNISNREGVIEAIDEVVQEALTRKKFGNQGAVDESSGFSGATISAI